jgi:hypothetical protein
MQLAPIPKADALCPSPTRRAALIRRAAVISVFALTLIGVHAPAASAGEAATIDTKGGYASFQDVGEGLFVNTPQRRVRGDRGASSAQGEASDCLRARWRRGKQQSELQDLSLREGTDLSVRICYVEHLWEQVRCSNRQSAEA